MMIEFMSERWEVSAECRRIVTARPATSGFNYPVGTIEVLQVKPVNLNLKKPIPVQY